MSDDQAGTEPVDTDTGAQPAVDPPTDPPTDVEPDPPSNEAAKYRRRLRDTEAERDQLAGQLDAMRRAEVTRLATTADGPRLHAAGDVFTVDYDLAELLTDDGAVDPDKVRAAIEHHTSGRHHLRADIRQPKPDPSQGSGRGAHAPVSTGQGWADALRRR